MFEKLTSTYTAEMPRSEVTGTNVVTPPIISYNVDTDSTSTTQWQHIANSIFDSTQSAHELSRLREYTDKLKAQLDATRDALHNAKRSIEFYERENEELEESGYFNLKFHASQAVLAATQRDNKALELRLALEKKANDALCVGVSREAGRALLDGLRTKVDQEYTTLNQELKDMINKNSMTNHKLDMQKVRLHCLKDEMHQRESPYIPAEGDVLFDDIPYAISAFCNVSKA